MFQSPFISILSASMAMGCSSGDEKKSDTGTEVPIQTLPQAMGGAFWANPDLYPEIPLKINADPGSQVEVDFDGQSIAATAEDFVHVATLSIADVEDGAHELSIRIDGEAIDAQPVLHIGRAGNQFTDWDIDT